MLYNEQAKQMMTEAIKIASEDDGIVGSEHILFAICKQTDTLASLTFSDYGITAEVVARYIKSGAKKSPVIYSSRVKWILKNACSMCEENAENKVAVEHVALSIFDLNDCMAMRIIKHIGVDYREIKLELSEGMRIAKQSIDDEQDMDIVKKAFSEIFGTNENELNVSEFGTEMVNAATEGKFDPLICRDAELDRLTSVLLRRSKNNPLLIGEPGVGKTAIVEGLAARIGAGQVPEQLKNKKILSLSIAKLTAGTKYRGDFEEKLNNMLDSIQKDKSTIVFIDEIHTIIGAGNNEGTQDVANLIKPYLSRAELCVIGATTDAEYRKYILSDRALERRFMPIYIKEPDIKDCIKMILGVKEKYVQHHKMNVSESVIEYAVKLSERFLPNRSFPDKAIDLLDETMSRKRLTLFTDEFSEIKKEDVKNTLSSIVGVNDMVFDLDYNEKELEIKLNERIYGQEQAIKQIVTTITSGTRLIGETNKPIAIMLFSGPSGVGKTSICKEIAAYYFGSYDNFIKLDMSEFSEPNSISSLLGSPSGYVGYTEGGRLFDELNKKPYSVVLFDEIEKGSKDIYNLLLQIADDGIVTDRKGQTISFKNTIIVLTTNVGASTITGFGSCGETYVADKILTKELSLRIDKEIIFISPSDKTLNDIIGLKIESIKGKLNDKKIKFEVSSKAKEFILTEAKKRGKNVRSLNAVFNSKIEAPLISAVYSNNVNEVYFDVCDKEIFLFST